jgi:hypothetical protein
MNDFVENYHAFFDFFNNYLNYPVHHFLARKMYVFFEI